MNQIILNKYDEIVMKLLHYFITVKGYSPIVLHGAQNEIWLENMNSDYKIIRIVTNYIHNDEQYEFDLFRTRKIMGRIKKKTFSFEMNGISIFLNLGENVHFDNKSQPKNLMCFNISDMDTLLSNKELKSIFVRPFSLALRLFANIFAGEVLVFTIVGIVAYFVPLPFMLFELFVALIQALVFTLLSTTYISMAVNEEE